LTQTDGPGHNANRIAQERKMSDRDTNTFQSWC